MFIVPFSVLEFIIQSFVKDKDIMESKILNVGIVLINWNSSCDTIECIESILKSNIQPIKIVVVDNNSNIIDRINLEEYISLQDKYLIELISNSINEGFSKANNQGLEFLQKDESINAYWILNNDTIVRPDTLSELLITLYERDEVGLSGSIMVYYDKPDMVQVIGGGKYFPFLGITKLIGKMSSLKTLDFNTVPKTSYLMGCSILVKQKCLDDIKGFDERFFVYGEDLDLSLRAIKLGWKLNVSMKSIVIHKDGNSTKGKKELFYYLFNKGNIVNVRIHKPLFLVPAIVFNLLNTIRLGKNWKNFHAGFKGVSEGILMKLK